MTSNKDWLLSKLILLKQCRTYCSRLVYLLLQNPKLSPKMWRAYLQSNGKVCCTCMIILERGSSCSSGLITFPIQFHFCHFGIIGPSCLVTICWMKMYHSSSSALLEIKKYCSSRKECHFIYILEVNPVVARDLNSKKNIIWQAQPLWIKYGTYCISLD